MKQAGTILLLSTVMLTLVHCGNNSEQSQDASTTSVNGFSISVEKVAEGTGENFDGSFFQFVSVRIRLSNQLDKAIPIAASLFRARINQLEVLPTANTSTVADACPTEALLAVGGTNSCTFRFSSVQGAPTAIVYDYFDVATSTTIHAEAPVTNIEPCERCGTNRCVDTQTDEDHCGACNQSITDATCKNGAPVCPSSETYCQTLDVNNQPNEIIRCTPKRECQGLARGEKISCDAVCSRQPYSKTCTTAVHVFANTQSDIRQFPATCAAIPDDSRDGLPYRAAVCTCSQ
jgi:hypothetical protein